jgi:hypothetical protein
MQDHDIESAEQLWSYSEPDAADHVDVQRVPPPGDLHELLQKFQQLDEYCDRVVRATRASLARSENEGD